MGKYYHGPTIDEIKNHNTAECHKKFMADTVAYFIRRSIMEFHIHPRTEISIPISILWCNRESELDWLTKELEEAGFKVTVEKGEELEFGGLTTIVDGSYRISWENSK